MGTTVTGKNGIRATDSTLSALPGGMGGGGESVIVADDTPSGCSKVTGKGGRGGDGGNGAWGRQRCGRQPCAAGHRDRVTDQWLDFVSRETFASGCGIE